VVIAADAAAPAGASGVSTHCSRLVSVLGVSGPGSTFRDCCPVSMPPLVLLNTGSSEISACGLPTGSQGIQML